MKEVIRLLCLTAVGALVACAANSAVPPPSTTAPDQSVEQNVWSLTFHLSGGFVGFDRELSLTSRGELKVSDRRRAVQAATQASANELAQIASMVAGLKAVEAGRRSLCNDCLQYDLSAQVNGRTVVSSLNDLSLPGNPVEPLVRLLTTMLNRELAAQANTQGR